MDQLEYLESEREKLWEKIVELQDQVNKRTADYEHDARQSSKKSSEYRNKCEASRDEAKALVDEIQKLLDKLKQSNATGLVSDLKDAHEKFMPRTAAMEVKLKELESLFASYTT